MLHISTHKLFAIAIYFLVNLIIYLRGDALRTEQSLAVLGLLLILVLFSGFVGWLMSWGMPAALASDHGTPIKPGIAAFFFWIIFLIGCLFFLLEWSVI